MKAMAAVVARWIITQERGGKITEVRQIMPKKTYIGCKVVWAEPAVGQNPQDEGYQVQYQDGYTSWSPKAVFENAYVESELYEVTPELVDSYIKKSEWTDALGMKTVVCCITLINGYEVIGTAASLTVEAFDYSIGKQASYDDAIKQVIAYLAFLIQAAAVDIS